MITIITKTWDAAGEELGDLLDAEAAAEKLRAMGFVVELSDEGSGFGPSYRAETKAEHDAIQYDLT